MIHSSQLSTTNNSILKIITAILFISLPFVGFFLGIKYQKSVSPEPEQTITIRAEPTKTTDETANWKTYRNNEYGFVFEYPPFLYSSGGQQQVFLIKKDASDVERLDYSDRIVEIRTDISTSRFETYFNTLEGSLVEGYDDIKIKGFLIGNYRAVEYGFDDERKEQEIVEQKEAIQAGAQVGMTYFRRGLLVNKNGTIIEVSTNAYIAEFTETFDQILSTFEFTD
jgi:hypothetical protein